jgi:hypothetical protein
MGADEIRYLNARTELSPMPRQNRVTESGLGAGTRKLRIEFDGTLMEETHETDSLRRPFNIATMPLPFRLVRKIQDVEIKVQGRP